MLSCRQLMFGAFNSIENLKTMLCAYISAVSTAIISHHMAHDSHRVWFVYDNNRKEKNLWWENICFRLSLDERKIFSNGCEWTWIFLSFIFNISIFRSLSTAFSLSERIFLTSFSAVYIKQAALASAVINDWRLSRARDSLQKIFIFAWVLKVLLFFKIKKQN